MKTLRSFWVSALCSLCLCVSLLSSACGTVSPQTGATTLRLTTSIGAGRILQNNPRYIPAAQALAAGIETAISAKATLTPENIAAFVRDLCANYDVAPPDAAEFVNLAVAIYETYVDTYRVQIVNTADPNVLLYIEAFRRGLLSAITTATPQ
jgi:hypothetical protein